MKAPAIALLLATSLLAPASALAVQGTGAYQVLSNSRSHRVATPAVQDRLSSSSAWQDFLQRRGGTWRVLWDEATATPIRFYGTGWAVDSSALAADPSAWQIGNTILAEEWALLGGSGAIDLDDLKPLVIDRSAGITTITYQRTWRDLPVLGARVSLRFKAGRFVMGQFESMPGVAVPHQPRISAKQAGSTALAAMSWPKGSTEVPAPPELLVLPLLRGHSADYRLAWSISLRAPQLPSSRQALVDAHSGEFLGWRERLRFLQGQVLAEHDDRFPGNGLVTSAMPHAELSGAGSAVQADQDGLFTLTTSEPIELHWSAGSEFFDIRALDPHGRAVFAAEFEEDGDILLASADETLSNADERRERAQIDAHISTHIVRDQALSINPNFAWAQDSVITRVNITDNRCNAWFDEEATLNFVIQGEGCNNTARIADVIYHEYGHGFHIFSIIPGAGGWGDGSLGEGLADYMAASITGTPDMAPGFFRQTDAPLRQLDNSARWPEDIEEDPHATGLIIGGALWHLRQALAEEYGEQQGVELADFLYWQAARRANDIPTVYQEILLADDDNGNLGDGTPNQCIIEEAFSRHGLAGGSMPGGSQVSHDAPTDLPEPGQDIPLELSVTFPSLNCSEESITSILLHYSYQPGEDPDDFSIATMTDSTGSGLFIGALPEPPESRFVRYYIDVLSDTGELLVRLPEGSRSDPWYGLWVGATDSLFETDFEDDDGGFAHELLSDSDQLGADDWQWGTPQGAESDPSAAFSGTRVWGNDLALESNWNGAYQQDVHNLLRSPDIDLPDLGEGDRILVQFRRWLNVEDGYFDQALLLVNGSEVWQQYASSDSDSANRHHQDHHWALRSYDVTDLVLGDDKLEVEWHLVTDGGLQMGGWTLDDFRVLHVEEEGEPPGGDDDDAGDDDDVDGSPVAGVLSASGCACSTGALTTAPGGLVALALLLAGILPRRKRTRNS